MEKLMKITKNQIKKMIKNSSNSNKKKKPIKFLLIQLNTIINKGSIKVVVALLIN